MLGQTSVCPALTPQPSPAGEGEIKRLAERDSTRGNAPLAGVLAVGAIL